jgi:hypothetical protein
MPRPDPMRSQHEGPHEKRFTMDDNFDKSTYLSRNPRSINHSFNTCARTPLAGEPAARNDYDAAKPKLMMMDRLDKLIPAIDRQSVRAEHNSIYRRRADKTPDYYDSVKIASTTNNLKEAKRGASLELKKQPKRDMTMML